MPPLPPVREFRQRGMHRLIPARYNETGTVLEEVAEDDATLRDAALLDAATNERIHGESYGLSGISQFELVYGIPNAQIIRAAFLHPGPFGARFNDTTRGAWYAAKRVETSIAEVAYHKARRLMEIVAPAMPGGRPDEEVSSYDDWQADFQASFHALDPAEEYAEVFFEPEPVPECYLPSQRLARQLLGGSKSERRPLSECAPSRGHMPGLLSSRLGLSPSARPEIRDTFASVEGWIQENGAGGCRVVCHSRRESAFAFLAVHTPVKFGQHANLSSRPEGARMRRRSGEMCFCIPFCHSRKGNLLFAGPRVVVHQLPRCR